MRIFVTYDPPPTSERNRDWKAIDFDSGAVGYGQAPEGALAELLCQLEDKAREVTDATCRDARDHLRTQW
jgi:hypothetical protein